MGETTERSAHLEKLNQLFEAAPISRYLGMTLSYCENGVARVRLPFRWPRRVQKYKRTQDPRAGLFRNKRVYAWLANGS